MSENAQFTEFLNDMLALALRDEDGLAEANATVEATDEDNGWHGALVEAWRDRWQPYAEERLFGAVTAMSAALRDKLR